jgi:hypothetical protein
MFGELEASRDMFLAAFMGSEKVEAKAGGVGMSAMGVLRVS